MKQKEYNLSKDEIDRLIDQWIFDEKASRIMRLRLFRNLTYERIAEEVDMSERQIPRIVNRNIKILFKHGLEIIS